MVGQGLEGHRPGIPENVEAQEFAPFLGSFTLNLSLKMIVVEFNQNWVLNF